MTISRGTLVQIVTLGALVLGACSTSKQSVPLPTGLGAPCGRNAPSCNAVWGFGGNSVMSGRTGATISGGGQLGSPNQVNGDFGAVVGGEGNVAGEGSFVGGGLQNTAINFHTTIGGGAYNQALAEEATVAGGFKNVASQRFSTVGGGGANIASDLNTTVGGGSGNVASFTFATVGGGAQNTASSSAAVVAGGDHNMAEGAYSSVLGGLNNDAGGYLTTIAGGGGNVASGSYSAIPGGFANSSAGAYSFAAGHKAEVSASHPGTFLFADSSTPAFQSAAPNEFAVRATGGVRLVTGIDPSGAPVSGVRLTAGSGSWETLSDYNAKAGIAPADEQVILERLMQIPIDTWSYRTQDPSIRHIGPMAQDFSAAFNVGDDPHYISTVDADGVALASIQELYRMLQSTAPSDAAARIDHLQQQLLVSNLLAGVSLLLALAALWRRTGASSVR